MSEVDQPYHDIVERELFLELVADGTPLELAGYEVQWTPRQIKRNLADPMFMEMVNAAADRAVDSIELAMFRLARKGNLGAQQMILYNRRPDRWKDLRRIEVKTETMITRVEIMATKEALIESLRELGTAALQPGGNLDGVIDVESSEDGDPSAA